MSSYQRNFTHEYYLFFAINIIIEYLHRFSKAINNDYYDDTIRSDSDSEEPSY